MCIGDSKLDTIREGEQDRLRAAATDIFPMHHFGVRENDEGIRWIVLEPPEIGADLLRVTICRLDPCIVVMVEDRSGRRQFCSTPGIDDAMAFATEAVSQSLGAATSAHPPHTVLQ